MAGAGEADGKSVHKGKVTSWLEKVFEPNPAGLNWPLGVVFLDIALVPLIFFLAIGHEEYFTSALFGALFCALAEPGGSYRHRASSVAVFGLIGTGLTALAFGIGPEAWGWLVLTAFAVTLAAGLTVTFGVHRFVEASLLNVWFIIALGLAVGLHQHPHVSSHIWAQVAAWAGGSALWIVLTFVEWLVRGRHDRAQLFEELPGDTTPRPLTRPLVMYAVIRALAVTGSVALAFGANLSHGVWLPIATIIAVKPSLQQTTLIAVQRLAGAAIGAGAAALLLLIPTSEHGLRLLTVDNALSMVSLVLVMHGIAIRFWNYAVYTAVIATAVLILVDLPQPSDYSANGYRVLWTLCGVGIGVLVMLLADRIAKRTAKSPPPSA
jgi:uncharacterized membrane protein YccC